MRAQQTLLQRFCHNKLVVRCLAAAAVRVGPARTDPAGRPMSGPSIPVVEPKKYDEQLSAKRQRVVDMFSDFSLPELQVFESARSHYRMRSEFRVWHDGEEMYPIMFRQGEDGKPERVRMDQYPVASMLINQHMELLMAHLRARPVLRDKLYQVNFHTAASGDAMVTLIYHKKLDSGWQKAAEALRKHLATAADSGPSLPSIIGRSRKQKVVLGQDFVIERMHVDGRDLCYKQMEGAFSQPNAGVAHHMLSWAVAATRGSSAADLLELYCGNGNFTIALAGNFQRVLATEISKSAIAAAQFNLKANDVGNVLVGRMSAEEFTAAWKANRSMKRLEGLDWDSLQLRTLLVDPPRAGLDSATERLLLEFDQVVYVSCNPETLHKNLQAVKSTHRIAQFALFDQFPYSDHVECGVLLQRIADSTE